MTFGNKQVWHWPHFTIEEMRCRCGCGGVDVDPEFMEWLEAVRDGYGSAMVVTSAYRCEAHDKSLGGAGRHTTGRAVDIQVNGGRALELMSVALDLNVMGLGVKQHGPHSDRFLHLDLIRPGGKHPAPWVWSYK